MRVRERYSQGRRLLEAHVEGLSAVRDDVPWAHACTCMRETSDMSWEQTMALTLTKPSAERALKSSSSPRRAIMVAASSRISSGSGSPDDDEEEDEDSEVALAGGWHFPQRCVEAAFVQESRLGCPPRPEGARPKTESLTRARPTATSMAARVDMARRKFLSPVGRLGRYGR